ncbi:MAG: MerR family transcriptional regulator [Gammaproteobacteria bacterium]|nr:MerR family transcriptional regulator [Gammaproteobacteria bacterium]
MNHYPIRAISELTGVPATTLRAWERRYGLLKPSRTEKGHRLYSGEDVELVKEVVRLLKKNHTISDAIRVINNPELKTSSSDETEEHWAVYQKRILKSIENFNEQNLGTAYNEALSLYPIDMVTQEVILPVLYTLGDRWKKRDAGIAEEHFFSAFLRNKLGARLHHESNRGRGNKILVACLPGEFHELGVLLFCIAAIGHGYQILYLGTDLPVEQLSKVAKRTDVSAVLLSGTNSNLWSKDIAKELNKNIYLMNIPIMFGGELFDEYKEQIESFGGYVLGSDHVKAIARMESVIPAFASKGA